MSVIMKKSTKLLIILATVAALAGGATLLFPPSPPVPPDTEFTLLDGKKTTLRELRGRPVLVNFWSITCAPCVEEIPDLIRLYHEWHPQGFELIAVAMPYDPPLQVQEFVKRHGVSYPVAFDVQGKVTHAFGGVSSVPAGFLIAPNGITELNFTGRLDVAKLRRTVARYLEKPAT